MCLTFNLFVQDENIQKYEITVKSPFFFDSSVFLTFLYTQGFHLFWFGINHFLVKSNPQLVPLYVSFIEWELMTAEETLQYICKVKALEALGYM